MYVFRHRIWTRPGGDRVTPGLAVIADRRQWNAKGLVMFENVRARSASKKGLKLIGEERYSEASFAFNSARDLYQKVGDFENSAVSLIKAKTAMKLAKKQAQSGKQAGPPSKEMQDLIIERWNAKIREITVEKSDMMTLTVDNERKMALHHKA